MRIDLPAFLGFGMHDNLGGSQSVGFQAVTERCGAQISIWATDFGFSRVDNENPRYRNTIVPRAKKAIENGASYVSLSWHQCNPTHPEPCDFEGGVKKQLTRSQYLEVLREGSSLEKVWSSQVAVLIRVLRELDGLGVPILFRPLHEGNLPNFWWHEPGGQLYRELWLRLRTKLDDSGLTNLLWVWSVAYHPEHFRFISRYYPGDSMVDVIGLDIYPSHTGEEPKFGRAWRGAKRVSRQKPIALTEVSRLPSRKELAFRGWAYVVPWGIDMLVDENDWGRICSMYRYANR